VNKELAVGATIEQVQVSGSTNNTTTPTRTVLLAGIPLAVNGGTPVTGIPANAPVFGLFTQGDRLTARFAVVPSGTIKVGYDFIPNVLSLTLAYYYLYLSSVGRVADQINSPGGVAQSSFFAQGITLGVKGKF
jgi:hypothetical protein